jgi:hypothetical protein
VVRTTLQPWNTLVDRRQFLIGGGTLALAGAAAAYGGLHQMGSKDAYDDAVAASRAALAQRPALRDLIRYATLAPSGHNTQPWRFRSRVGHIDILADFSRRTPVVDPDDHHLFIGLGAATENLVLAAAAQGQSGEATFSPDDGGSVRFSFGRRNAVESALVDAIPHRQSTRADYDGRAVSTADLNTLHAAAATPGVDLVLLTDRPRMDRVRDLVVAGNSAQMASVAFIRELKAWLRYSPRQAMEAGDGLYSASSGNPALPTWLGPFMFDRVFHADSENDKYARQLRSSSGIAVFVAQSADPEHWVRVGRACQRFALQATALGLRHSFVNQPAEVESLRPALAGVIGMPGRRPDLVMRFGYGANLPFSARRPVASVLMA